MKNTQYHVERWSDHETQSWSFSSSRTTFLIRSIMLMLAIMLPFSPVSSRKSTSFARALLSCLSVGYFSHHRAFFLHFKEFLHLFLFLATSFLSSLFLVDISLISIKPFSVSCNARSKPHAMHLAWSWSFPWPLLTFGAIIKVDDQ
jgi:hypothetical protein